MGRLDALRARPALYLQDVDGERFRVALTGSPDALRDAGSLVYRDVVLVTTDERNDLVVAARERDEANGALEALAVSHARDRAEVERLQRETMGALALDAGRYERLARHMARRARRAEQLRVASWTQGMAALTVAHRALHEATRKLDEAPWRNAIGLAHDIEGRITQASLFEAREEALAELAAASDDPDYEWPDGVGTIGYGVLLERATEHPAPLTCGECDGLGAHVEGCEETRDLAAVDYRLEPVPGAVEAVLALADTDQLRAELARRDSGWTPSDPYIRWTGREPALTEAGRAELARRDAQPALTPAGRAMGLTWRELPGTLPAVAVPDVAPEPQRSRWTMLSITTPSGKTLFQCGHCGRESTTPDKVCNAGCSELAPCINTLARTAEDQAHCALNNCPHRPVGCDWRAALTAAGLVRDEMGWMAGDDRPISRALGRGTYGWYVSFGGAPQFWDTEAEAARAWLAGRVTRG